MVRRRGETNRTIWAKVSLKIAETEQLYQVKRTIGGIGDMWFSIYSQTENVYDPTVSLVNLWGQVTTLRGQLLASRIGDATLRVVRLCVVRFVLLVCNVCVGAVLVHTRTF